MFKSTATRVSMYLATTWLVVGFLALYMWGHHHQVGLAGVIFAAAAGGSVITVLAGLVRTKTTWVKVVGEPVALVGVILSGVGFWQGEIMSKFNPIFDLIIGAIILAFFIGSMVEQVKEDEMATRREESIAANRAAKAAAEFAQANELNPETIGVEF